MFPIDALSQEDKDCIKKYVEKYGHIDNVNVDIALKAWNKNKIKLFKAFGRKLRVSYPIKIEMNEKEFVERVREFYPKQFSFAMRDVYNYPQPNTFIYALGRYVIEKVGLSYEDKCNIERLLSYNALYHGVVPCNMYFDSMDKPPLKLQKGAKIMKAIQRVCTYIDFGLEYPFVIEEFRNNVSNVTTQKYIDANLVFSIHPIDYMTMSDNECDWSSCMSWKHGSYHGGTLEMLNSNVAVVAYLEKNGQPTFKEWPQIPNKSWRCLYYVHKDIILSGKPYPYYNKELVRQGLDKLADLVYTNMRWEYKFKNQRYKDNIHWRSSSYPRINRPDVKSLPKNKRNIVVYTYGMYNDMAADTDQQYWCYRNKPKKPLYLCLSGCATCMHCGEPFDNNDDGSGGTCADKYYYDEDYWSYSNLVYCVKCQKQYECCCCDHLKTKNIINNIPIINMSVVGKDWVDNKYKLHYSSICEKCLREKYLYNKQMNAFVYKDTYQYYQKNDQQLNAELGPFTEVKGSIVDYFRSLQTE